MDLDKVLGQVQPEYAGRVVFVRVNVNETDEQSVVDAYRVERVPYSVTLDVQGNRVETLQGTASAATLRSLLDRLVNAGG